MGLHLEPIGHLPLLLRVLRGRRGSKKKHSTTLIPPPSDDKERDEITETTLLSLTLHKTALAAEAQENVANVQEKLADEEIEKMVKGEEDE
ncbi:hypothetical protein Tco_0457110, partial [Tanacetum coccineum]